MLPVITEQTRLTIEKMLAEDEAGWKKQMVHRLKAENPEINSLLLELAQKSSDPKAVIVAGYLIYDALEMAHKEEET